MKTAVFGGTFDPIHLGHVALAQHFSEALQPDRLLLIPTSVPPHKQATQLATGAQRLEMCRLAAMEIPRCEVCDLELKRPGRSYTVDTLEALHAMGEGDFYLLMGADMFLSLERWRNFSRIAQLAVLCAAPRQEEEYAALCRHAAHLERQWGARTFVGNFSVLELSSTYIRQRLKRGEPCRDFLLPAVEAYICKNGLYGVKRPFSGGV